MDERNRALLDLLGEGCCCCCEDDHGPQTERAPRRLGQPAPGGGLHPETPPDHVWARRGTVPDEPFVPPVHDFDAWPRPVLIGKTAMTLPTRDGALLVGQVKTPLSPHSSTALISHIEGAIIRRPDLLRFRGTRLLLDGEAAVRPFHSRQHVLTDEFPTAATLPTTTQGEYRTEPWDDGDTQPRWRIKGELGQLVGEYAGKVERVGLTGSPDRSWPPEEVTKPDVAPTLEVEALMWFGQVRQVREDGGTLLVRVPGGYWAVPDELWVEDMADVQTGLEPSPELRPVVRQLSAFCTRDEESLDGTGRTYPVRRIATPGDRDPRGLYQTRWRGRTSEGADNQLVAVSRLPEKREYVEAPYGTIIARYPVHNLIWVQWIPKPIKDPTPYDHQYEADLPGLGPVTAGGDPGTVSTGTHLDHPRAQDNGFVRLGGVSLRATSWAVLARPTRTRDGHELGLLTCDGATLTVRWPGQAVAEVTLDQVLADLPGQRDAPSVTDAVLESELDLYQHPDNVRLVWGQGQRAALIVAWEPWRDWTAKQWRRAKKARPRTLKAWLKVKPKDWPVGPPLPTPTRPNPVPHDLTVVGRIAPPPLDEVRLPRYGPTPVVAYPARPDGVPWPWAERRQMDRPDPRAELAAHRVTAFPEVPEGGITVARIRGRLPNGAHWIGPETTRAGLRMCAVVSRPQPVPAAGTRLQHLATYLIPGDAAET